MAMPPRGSPSACGSPSPTWRGAAARSGAGFAPISTADTARDLDQVRVLMGEEKLTYVGLSYGTLPRPNLRQPVPRPDPAMILNSIVDRSTKDSKGAEARVCQRARAADPVFASSPLALRRRGPERCALARGRHTAAERLRAVARVKRAPIPAPGVRRRSRRPGAHLRRSAGLPVQPLRAPRRSGRQTRRTRRRRAGRRIGARERGLAASPPPAGWAGDDLGGDLLRRRVGPQGVSGPGRR